MKEKMWKLENFSSYSLSIRNVIIIAVLCIRTSRIEYLQRLIRNRKETRYKKILQESVRESIFKY